MGGEVTFGYEELCAFFMQSVQEFVSQWSRPFGIGLFSFLFVFHLVEGAAELSGSQPWTCRFFDGRFWGRVLMWYGLLTAYEPVVLGLVAKVQPMMMAGFGADWYVAWQDARESIERSQQAAGQNGMLQAMEVMAMGNGSGATGGWLGGALQKLMLLVADKIVSGLGLIGCYFAAGLIMLWVIMQGFHLVAVTTLLCAVGPVFVAAGLHPKTESLGMRWVHAFLLYGVFFGLLLVLAVRMGGGAMALMDRMVVTSGIPFGDGSDVMVHLVQVLLGPLVVLVCLRAAPEVAKSLMSVSMGSGEGGYAAALGLVLTSTQNIVRSTLDSKRSLVRRRMEAAKRRAAERQ
jgi:hypothetical protein